MKTNQVLLRFFLISSSVVFCSKVLADDGINPRNSKSVEATKKLNEEEAKKKNGADKKEASKATDNLNGKFPDKIKTSENSDLKKLKDDSLNNDDDSEGIEEKIEEKIKDVEETVKELKEDVKEIDEKSSKINQKKKEIAQQIEDLHKTASSTFAEKKI